MGKGSWSLSSVGEQDWINTWDDNNNRAVYTKQIISSDHKVDANGGANILFIAGGLHPTHPHSNSDSVRVRLRGPQISGEQDFDGDDAWSFDRHWSPPNYHIIAQPVPINSSELSIYFPDPHTTTMSNSLIWHVEIETLGFLPVGEPRDSSYAPGWLYVALMLNEP